MPTGTPYGSFVLPYRIRVDEFGENNTEMAPLLHLLTHTHTDHINGLSAKSFASTVICSPDAKEMLLRHEVYAERALKEMDIRAENVRTFQHLRVNAGKINENKVYNTGSRDLLKTLPLNTPTRYELSNDNWVTITLFDANHCPGAVMFLIEGLQGAVLHTGDFRAEPWFLDSLKKNPLLQRYLAPVRPASKYNSAAVCHTLEAIYLDTACVLNTDEIPTKEYATTGLISLMELFSSRTLFFINSWTWGYEDIFKAVARAFHSKIHVDRYKYSVYSHIGDPFLRSLITQDEGATRFHACERFDRCEQVKDDDREGISPMGREIVYVNPVNMTSEGWENYMKETRAQLIRGERVCTLLVPLYRHSTLPELQSFVSLFKPKKLVPNTLDLSLRGLDWWAMSSLFEGCLASNLDMGLERLSPLEMEGMDIHSDVSLKNLEGKGSLDLAEQWVSGSKLSDKLEVIRKHIKEEQRLVVDRILGNVKPFDFAPSKVAIALPSEMKLSTPDKLLDATKEVAVPLLTPTTGFQGRATAMQTERAMSRLKTKLTPPPAFLHSGEDSDTEDDEAEEARARTAHHIFAPLLGVDSQVLTIHRTVNPVSAMSSPVHSNAERSSPPAPPLRLESNTPSVITECLITPSRIANARAPLVQISQQLPQNPVLLRPQALLLAAKFNDLSRKASTQQPSPPPDKLYDTYQKTEIAHKTGIISLRVSNNASQALGINVDGPVKRKRSVLFDSRKCENKQPSDNEAATSTSSFQGNDMKRARIADNPSTLQAGDKTLEHSVTRKKSLDDSSKHSVKINNEESKIRRNARRAERKRIAEMLSQARPDLATPTHAAKLERRQIMTRSLQSLATEPGSASICLSLTSLASLTDLSEIASIPPSSVPSLGDMCYDDCGELEMDMERSRELAKVYRERLARGEEPGAVIPRLSCLESQEAEW